MVFFSNKHERYLNNNDDQAVLKFEFVDTHFNCTHFYELKTKLRRGSEVSLINNIYLQRYAKLQFGKEANLELDVIHHTLE